MTDIYDISVYCTSAMLIVLGKYCQLCPITNTVFFKYGADV